MSTGPRWLTDYLFEGVVQVVETGPRSVRFIFESAQPIGRPEVARVGWIPVLPRHFWRGRDFRAPIMEPPLVSGRYRVAAVDPAGRSIIYEQVDDYGAREIGGDGTQAGTERITYRYVTEGAPHDDEEEEVDDHHRS